MITFSNFISKETSNVITMPSGLSRENFVFGGWYESKDCSGKLFEFNIMPDRDVTLYAKWLEEYGVIWILDGGSLPVGETNPIKYTIEDTFIYSETAGDNELLITEPTKGGYNFAGWYVNSEFELWSKIDDINDLKGKDITLYAKWNTISYTITYDLDGGTNDEINPVSYNVETATITLEDATKDGYIFAGWWTADGTDDDWGAQVTGIATGSTGNKSLYAKWTAVP